MKLLEQVRQLARVKHFSYRTEQAYAYWIERYIRHHGIRHPSTMSAAEVEQFLTHLAVDGHVAASTQNQALAALLFLYRDALKMDLGTFDAVRVRRPKRVPLVLSAPEVAKLIRLTWRRDVARRADAATLAFRGILGRPTTRSFARSVGGFSVSSFPVIRCADSLDLGWYVQRNTLAGFLPQPMSWAMDTADGHASCSISFGGSCVDPTQSTRILCDTEGVGKICQGGICLSLDEFLDEYSGRM